MKRTYKEMKFRPNIGQHDLETKIRQIRGFLEKKLQVKISIIMRGRENLHRELGMEVINKLIEATKDLGKMDKVQINNNMYYSTLSPFLRHSEQSANSG
jgi:translation initiation factor IF-3